MQRLKALMFGSSSAAILLLVQTYFACTSAFAPALLPRLSGNAHGLHRRRPRARADAVYSRSCLTRESIAITMVSTRKQHPASKVRSTLQKLLNFRPIRRGRRLTPGSDAHLQATMGLGEKEEGSVGETGAASAAAQGPEGLVSTGAAESTIIKDAPLPFSVAKLIGSVRKFVKNIGDVPEDAADEGKFLVMAALVGVLTGVAVTVFKTMIAAVKEASYVDLIARVPTSASACVMACIPVLGAVVVVGTMSVMGLKSYGPGLGGLTEEVDKQVPWNPRRTFGKAIAAVATLGTGNSLGPEGPSVEIGVAASRYVSSLTNLSVERQRMLLGAGAAGGVAAGFNAPIAGIFFALEIVKDTFNTNYNSKSFIAATLLCAVVSALMAKIGLHDELSLRPAAYNLESPLVELPLYLGLGVVAGLVAVMFKYFSRKSGDVFEGNFPGFGWMKKVPQWSKPIMMAAVTGIVGIFYPQVLFFGYDTLDKLLANTASYSLPLLGFLCVAKALLTAGALGSGLVGGTFAPALFLGATAGASYQRILQGSLTAFRTTAGPALLTVSTFILPVSSRLGLGSTAVDVGSLLTIAGSPAYSMVGAAAVLSALYRAPLTGSLLLFELTQDYDIVLPLMAAAGISSLVVEVFSRADSEKLAAMPRDMSLEIGLKISGKVDQLMGKVQVADALVPRVLTLTADMSLPDAMRAFSLTRNEFAIVIDQLGLGARTLLAEDLWERRDVHLVGVLALREIMLALERERMSSTADGAKSELTAGSVCRQNCFTVKSNTDIAAARNVMDSKGVRYLPVVADAPSSYVPLPAAVWRPQYRDGKARQDSAAGAAAVDAPLPAVVGVLSRDSVRVARRITETERAIREVSA